MISLKTTAMIVGSAILSTILVFTLFILSGSHPKPATAAAITPVKQEITVVTDKEYAPLTGDEYVAYLKAEEERKAAEEAARIAAEQEAARKAEEEKKAKEAQEAAERKRVTTSSSSSSTYSPPPAGTPEPGSAKAYAAQQVANKGWGTDQYDCLVALWQKESGWNHYALNKSSGAYGIPQSLPGSKMASAGADWETNYETQINWGLGYISGRYGTPCSAWGHSQSTGWY